jgi:type IV pilus assembly protein PilW
MRRLTHQTGISLVEVLVALVISLFLLAGIVQVYSGNKTTFTFTNALAEVQENGRFALDYMSQDLRLANEWGCVPFDPADTANINDTLPGSFAGYDNTIHDFLGQQAIQGTDNDVNGSDTVTIRGGKPGQSNVESPFFDNVTRKLRIGATSSLSAGDFVLLTRCGINDLLMEIEADILRVSGTSAISATQTELDFNADKSQQFENDASVIELQTVTYSIGNSALDANVPVLIRTEFGVAQELIEGVEQMEILYGIDDDDDQFPNQYVTANEPGIDFQSVVSIRVMLLLRSDHEYVTEAPQAYSILGVTTTPADRRLRQVFTTTIALRNRIGSSL